MEIPTSYSPGIKLRNRLANDNPVRSCLRPVAINVSLTPSSKLSSNNISKYIDASFLTAFPTNPQQAFTAPSVKDLPPLTENSAHSPPLIEMFNSGLDIACFTAIHGIHFPWT